MRDAVAVEEDVGAALVELLSGGAELHVDGRSSVWESKPDSERGLGEEVPDGPMSKRWVVFCKPTAHGAERVIEYLGR